MQAEDLVDPASPGAVTITGRLLDGAGAPVPDGMLEIWQADAAGVVGSSPGFGRCLTDTMGRYRFTTVKPGPVDAEQAPHVDVSIFARGLLQRLVTRLYFPDEPANLTDPTLLAVAPDRRRTLIATSCEGALVFDVILQGEGETVFFTW